MMKSHVSLEQQVCVVCTENFDTGSLLVNRRLRNSLEHTTTTGWGMCPKCTKMKDEGYVALIGIDEAKSSAVHRADLKPGEAYRTGDVAHIRSEVWDHVFTIPIPEKRIAFVGDEVMQIMKRLQERIEKPL